MTRVMSVATVAVFSALAAYSAIAQLPAAASSQAPQPGPTVVSPGDKPFQGIFGAPATQPSVKALTPRVALRTSQSTATRQPSQYVVCGLTVIRVDPKLDAGMLVRPKPGQTAAPKARIIEPKICR